MKATKCAGGVSAQKAKREDRVQLPRRRSESWMDDLLREGYEEMAQHDKRLSQEFEDLDRETHWPEYAE
jgi:hypothetical protein